MLLKQGEDYIELWTHNMQMVLEILLANLGYIIEVQNLNITLVSATTSCQHAPFLLCSALEKCWLDLARDLLRFLKVILRL